MVTSEEIVQFLRTHRDELRVLRDMFDETPETAEDRVAIERRIACVEALLRERGVRSVRERLH